MKKTFIRLEFYVVQVPKRIVLWSLAFALLLATAPVVAQDELADEISATDNADATDIEEDDALADDAADELVSESESASVSLEADSTEPESVPESADTNDTNDTNDTAEAEEVYVETNDATSSPDDAKDGEKKILSKASKLLNSIGIWKLTDDAYPTYKNRGITGGSLWRNFHGLQWPVMHDSGIGVSGSIWVDTGYEQIDRSESNQPDSTFMIQEGRAVLRMTPTYTRDRWFIQGQAEFVANMDQSAGQPRVGDTDDLWVRVGMWNLFDIQAGRYEAWELYHLGMGLDLNTMERRGAFEANSNLNVPGIYGVTATYYRPSGPGNIAAHLYPFDFFRVELLGQVGNDGGLNTTAFRGAGVLDLGFLKLKGGGEYQAQSHATEGNKEKLHLRGFGGSAQFIIKKYVEFGGSYGWSISDKMDRLGNIEEEASVTTWSAGGFLNFRILEDLLIGGGAHYTFLWDIHKDEDNKVGKYGHLQSFAAIQYLLLDRLYIKAVGAYARGDFDPSFSESAAYSTYMLSGRLRLQYDF